MTKIIGLTGGIGSGKSTVANFFREHGVPVYFADDHAKKLLERQDIINAIRAVFGEKVILNQRINRELLAGIVFNDPGKLKELNAIIHPEVRKDFAEWKLEHSEFALIIKEAAILFETGSDKECDAVITVSAPLEIRISRVMERDNISREGVLKRIKNQWTDELRNSKSDYIIVNISRNETEQQVSEILKKLRNI